MVCIGRKGCCRWIAQAGKGAANSIILWLVNDISCLFLSCQCKHLHHAFASCICIMHLHHTSTPCIVMTLKQMHHALQASFICMMHLLYASTSCIQIMHLFLPSCRCIKVCIGKKGCIRWFA